MSNFTSLLRWTAPLALLAVSACATPFKADVTRFQALPVPQGQTFVIRAADQENQGGLEFSRYASLVASRLTETGYQPAADTASANLIVSLDYGVDKGREKIRSTPGFGGFGGFGYGGFGYGGFGGGGFGGPFFGGRRGFIYGFNDPFLFNGFGGGFNDVESYTVYTSGIDMTITRKGTGERVFEGKAEAMSTDNRLPRLVPNLIEAMFAGFPGNSGETVRITIAPDKNKPPRITSRRD